VLLAGLAVRYPEMGLRLRAFMTGVNFGVILAADDGNRPGTKMLREKHRRSFNGV
jgi:hypothetical protein